MRHCLRHPTFSHFCRTPTCDRHTDTDKHRAMAYTAHSMNRAVKMTIDQPLEHLSNQTDESLQTAVDIQCPAYVLAT